MNTARVGEQPQDAGQQDVGSVGHEALRWSNLGILGFDPWKLTIAYPPIDWPKSRVPVVMPGVRLRGNYQAYRVVSFDYKNTDVAGEDKVDEEIMILMEELVGPDPEDPTKTVLVGLAGPHIGTYNTERRGFKYTAAQNTNLPAVVFNISQIVTDVAA